MNEETELKHIAEGDGRLVPASTMAQADKVLTVQADGTPGWKDPTGGGEPEAYLKDASVSGETLTLTKKDNTTVTFGGFLPMVAGESHPLAGDLHLGGHGIVLAYEGNIGVALRIGNSEDEPFEFVSPGGMNFVTINGLLTVGSPLTPDSTPVMTERLCDNRYALISTVTAKYTKPAGGIPASDMTSAVQTSLGKADTALPRTTLSGVTFDFSTMEGVYYAVKAAVQAMGATVTGGPFPTITGAQTPGLPANTVMLEKNTPFTITGTNLGQPGDVWWTELYMDGVLEDKGNMTAKGKVVSATSTTVNLSGAWWDGERPDGDWLNAYPNTKIVLVRGGVRTEFPMTFVQQN